jgi:four helix bundle protein
MFSFEKLAVWQKAIEYADLIYKVTKDFPADERFGLTSQLRRSAVSVSANIAEGSSRSSRADMARFIEIAYGSLLESVTSLEMAKRQQFLSQATCGEAYRQAETLAKVLSGFRRTVKGKPSPNRGDPTRNSSH